MRWTDVGEPLRSDDPPRLGNWRALRRLGSGGMGSVLLAERDGEFAAIKTVNPWLANDRLFQARFRREAAISGKVSGPHVADLVDFDVDGETPWLALRYVPGDTLWDQVEERGPLTGTDLKRFAATLAEGLASVHAAGITHRDLKPNNLIMLDGSPVIIDFGIARIADGTPITATSQGIGSAGWMPPEQLLGKEATASADVFAWGALVAFASTGRPPFGAGSLEATTYRVIHGEPDIEGCAADLQPLVTAALHKSPVSRPTVDTIREVLAGKRQLPKPVAPTVANALAPATASAFDTPAQIPVGQNVSPATAPSRARGLATVLTVAVVVAVVLVAGWLGMRLLTEDRSPEDTQLGSEPSSDASSDDDTSSEVNTAPSIPEFDDSIDPHKGPEVRRLAEFIDAHVQETVRLNVQWAPTDRESFRASNRGLVVCPNTEQFCEDGMELGIEGLRDAPDAGITGLAGVWQLVGTFVVQSTDIGTGGVWIVHLRAVDPTATN